VSDRKPLVEFKCSALLLPLTFEINASKTILEPFRGIPEVRTLKSSQ
jgi:hypothetical protein